MTAVAYKLDGKDFRPNVPYVYMPSKGETYRDVVDKLRIQGGSSISPFEMILTPAFKPSSISTITWDEVEKKRITEIKILNK